ncbi:MAG: hypothetical protein ACD_2C00019G0002 [uncultured bacterium (gcode 4)]|uniref:Uncharacterized protein n=1 Tax=uncultured bacterium (gcode 4) TaxID=1234023 RepID=K2G7A8_9BACT|nr:MAG: hypothetical protein ACD_2C00019G0002 [uncultured bacterium (gcode 4)]
MVWVIEFAQISKSIVTQKILPVKKSKVFLM